MANLNKVMLIGNVGKDPELRYTSSGSPVVGFNIAVNNIYTTADGEKKQDTEWFTVTAWNKLAEIVNQFVVKGMSVYVEGRLKTRSWDDEGIKRYKTEVIASHVQFLSKVDKTVPAEPLETEEIEPEDLPF